MDTRRRIDALAPALLAAVVAAAFLPSLFGGFVHDDFGSVVENPFLREGPWWRALTDPSRADPFGYVRPLRSLEFALDYALGGGTPFVFHLHSLLWHVVAATLLFFLLRRLAGDGHAALLGAFVWAVHPAQVEPVAWISAHGDVAMGACVFGSILFALRADGLGRDLVVSCAFAAAAPLYKETAVVLPLVVFALRRLKLSRAPVWPYVAVVAAFFAYRAAVPSGGARADQGFVQGGSFVGLVATDVRAFGWYVVETLIPSQSLDWYMTPSRSFADGAVVAWLVVHAALVGSAVLARRRAPLWTTAVAWLYVFLLPVANWPIPVGKPTSERYLYAALAGAALALAWALARSPRALWTATLVVAAAFVARTLDRQRMWKDDETLMTAVLADHESPGARYYFAWTRRDEALRARGDSARSKALFETSLAHARRAAEIWRAYDPSPATTSPILRRFELLASNDCYRLGLHDEALARAEEAARIGGPGDGASAFARALPLLALGYAPQAVDAALAATAAGNPPPEAAQFLVLAATSCEDAGLFAATERALRGAAAVAPDAAARADAERRLASLLARPRPATAEADERERVRRLEDDLARRVRAKL